MPTRKNEIAVLNDKFRNDPLPSEQYTRSGELHFLLCRARRASMFSTSIATENAIAA
jgi:hypothetical protein